MIDWLAVKTAIDSETLELMRNSQRELRDRYKGWEGYVPDYTAPINDYERDILNRRAVMDLGPTADEWSFDPRFLYDIGSSPENRVVNGRRLYQKERGDDLTWDREGTKPLHSLFKEEERDNLPLLRDGVTTVYRDADGKILPGLANIVIPEEGGTPAAHLWTNLTRDLDYPVSDWYRDNKDAMKDVVAPLVENAPVEAKGFWANMKGLENNYIQDLIRLRQMTSKLRFLRDNYPERYNAFYKGTPVDDYLKGVWKQGGRPQSGDYQEETNPYGRTAEQRATVHDANMARRWGNSQIQLTPEQYAYWDAKRQYNDNPGDTRYNLMMQAKRPLKPVDLQNIKKYTVQQRIMNTPQPNGLPKTPQMLQREWQDENKRRQTVARDMYKNEVKGLKNRTGVNAVPTMIQPWGGR